METNVKIENGLLNILTGKVPSVLPDVAPEESEDSSDVPAAPSAPAVPLTVPDEVAERKSPLEGVSSWDLFFHLFDVIYTVSEVCSLLKVSKPTVIEWIKSGNLTAFNVGSKSKARWRIRAMDLVAMAKRNVVNLPHHLQEPNDAFAGLVAVWDEATGAMNLIPDAEAKRLREERERDLEPAIEYLRERGML